MIFQRFTFIRTFRFIYCFRFILAYNSLTFDNNILITNLLLVKLFLLVCSVFIVYGINETSFLSSSGKINDYVEHIYRKYPGVFKFYCFRLGPQNVL